MFGRRPQRESLGRFTLQRLSSCRLVTSRDGVRYGGITGFIPRRCPPMYSGARQTGLRPPAPKECKFGYSEMRWFPRGVRNAVCRQRVIASPKRQWFSVGIRASRVQLAIRVYIRVYAETCVYFSGCCRFDRTCFWGLLLCPLAAQRRNASLCWMTNST